MEALSKILGASVRRPRELQVGEELLNLIGNTVVFAAVHCRVVSVRVDMLPDRRGHEECLDQRVHVARCSLILQTDIGA